MRGAPPVLLGVSVPHGIISADAGSTPECGSPCPHNADHPRGCGEHFLLRSSVPVLGGSSPRMRGARIEKLGTGKADRIIPADAGSTKLNDRNYSVNGDHPRGCGEHNSWVVRMHWNPGSSPRMRGARHAGIRYARRRRIIPADAGSTTICIPPAPAYQDHPRGCGEHDEGTRQCLIRMGSSPRMRGARMSMSMAGNSHGIIPADAGSTDRQESLGKYSQDHPRGCGEHRMRGLFS